MSCFKGLSVKSCFPIKTLRKGGSRLWRSLSRKNSANYSFNHEFMKAVSENPKYTQQELKKNTNTEQLQLEEIAVHNKSEEENIINTEQESTANEISSGENGNEENECIEQETNDSDKESIPKEITSGEKETSKEEESDIDSSQITEDSDESHYLTCGESTYGHSYSKLEQLLSTNLESSYESITNGSSEVLAELHMEKPQSSNIEAPIENEAVLKDNPSENEEIPVEARMENKEKQDSETKLKIDQAAKMDTLDNTVQVPEDQPNASSRNEQNSRQSQDYDLIDYSSVNLTELMTRVYDSIAETPGKLNSAENQRNIVDLFSSSIRKYEAEADGGRTSRIKENLMELEKYYRLQFSDQAEIVGFGPNQSQAEIVV